jgi:hypothetical protein
MNIADDVNLEKKRNNIFVGEISYNNGDFFKGEINMVNKKMTGIMRYNNSQYCYNGIFEYKKEKNGRYGICMGNNDLNIDDFCVDNKTYIAVDFESDKITRMYVRNNNSKEEVINDTNQIIEKLTEKGYKNLVNNVNLDNKEEVIPDPKQIIQILTEKGNESLVNNQKVNKRMIISRRRRDESSQLKGI